MKRFQVVLEYDDARWIAQCEELRITLEAGSFDALVTRMKVAIQDIVEVELGYTGSVEILISVLDRVEEIKAAS